jgi:hypothetical protein
MRIASARRILPPWWRIGHRTLTQEVGMEKFRFALAVAMSRPGH